MYEIIKMSKDEIKQGVADAKRENIEYEAATKEWAIQSIESVEAEIKKKDAKYDCGGVFEEVSELSFKVKFKEGSLFQPHSGTLDLFAHDALKSLVEGELNTLVGLRIENPEG